MRGNEAMDAIRDEMAKAGNDYIQTMGELLTEFLRIHPEAEEPDKPWRTVEFSPRTGTMRQDRGFGNDRQGKTPELRAQLDAFWQAFAQKNAQRVRVSV